MTWCIVWDTPNHYALELETAIADATDASSDLLSTKIMRNPKEPSVFHSDFDNFDNFVNRMEGAGSVHTAHGIMLQDHNDDEVAATRPYELPQVPKTKKRSYVAREEELPPCYMTKRKGPDIKIKTQTVAGSHIARERANKINSLWVLAMSISSGSGQEVPGWNGFISENGVPPSTLTFLDYYPVINHPITEYCTIQECLRVSAEATKEVGHDCVITTFDLGVCMKAFPLVWTKPGYEKHIILIGSFHLIWAYLKMVGKKMADTGFQEVLLEAELTTSGSMKGIIGGTNYARAMFCHKSIVEALERLLLQRFTSENHANNKIEGFSSAKLRQLVEQRCDEHLDLVLDDPGLMGFLEDYESFKDSIREGKLGKSPQQWMSYMDHVWLVLGFIFSVKTNDFELYHACTFQMRGSFFVFNGQNYARYLTYFSAFLANLDESHPEASELFRAGALSVARSFVPGNRCAVDKTIEETFMKHSKTRGGISGL